MKCVPKTGIFTFFARPVTLPLWLKNAPNNSTCHPRFRPRFPPNHPNLSALFLIPWEWSGLQPGEACSSRLSFIPGSVLGFGVGLLKPENWWVSILGSVLGFSLIILKSKPFVFWHVLEDAKKLSRAKKQAFLLCSILGSVLGFSLIILNGRAHKYHFWWFDIHKKRRETKTQIILGFILRVGWKKS